jgi:type 1 glutamine amidotransferase
MKKLCRIRAIAVTAWLFATVLTNAAEPANKPTVVLISGEFEYKSSETLPAFKRFLETNHGFNCIFLERTQGEDIPGLDALDRADLVLLFARRMTLPAKQLGKIKQYVESGRPLIGLRTASHAFENWKEWDHDVLGGNYHNHHANELVATIRVAAGAADHPILKGVEKEFIAGGSLYRNAPLPPSSAVLLTGSVTNLPPEPVAWTHSYKGARIFYTSLGHPKDFENSSFRRLLVNAIFWTLNRPAPEAGKAADKKPN